MTSRSWGDLKKTADDASRPIPKDWYDVIISKAVANTASTGSPMIKVQMKVVGGPYNNRVLFTNFVLSTENAVALSIFFRNVDAFGLDDAFFTSLGGADSDPAIGMQTVAAALIGRTARAEVGIRTWQGQERNEVQQCAKPQAGIGSSMMSSPMMSSPIASSRPTDPTIASVPVVPTVPVTPTAQAHVDAPPVPPVF